jgi:hypothetical protein
MRGQKPWAYKKTMPVHKLYCDSRAAVDGSPSDWLWQPSRSIHVGKCRAFIDSVHMGVTFGSVVESNRNIYVSEELPLLTVLAQSGRVYFREGATELIATIAPAIYDGPTLATALAAALSAASPSTVYSAAYTAAPSGASLGTIAITPPVFIASRATVVAAKSWAGQTLAPNGLQDASDLLGTTTADSQGTLNLDHGIGYRRVSLDIGGYNADELAAEMAQKLNSGSALTGAYSVSFDEKRGRLTISHDNPYGLIFRVFPESYLTTRPQEFQGFSSPYNGSDLLTGFHSTTAAYKGNAAVAAGHVNVLAYHTLFINSTLGMHNDSIGPVGQTTIARKVVIDAPPGGMVHDFHSTPYDYITIEPQSISSIRFRVTDWRGETVTPMSHWSASILLVPEEEF